MEETGKIYCGHCTCMAGLGETAAFLFYIEAKARIPSAVKCTQKTCEWVIPNYVKNMEYLPIAVIRTHYVVMALWAWFLF